MSLRHNCQMGHHCVYHTFSLRVKKKKKKKWNTERQQIFKCVYPVCHSNWRSQFECQHPPSCRTECICVKSPPPLFFCECLPPSFFFFFFSKPTPDEMEIANRVIEFKKKKNRHITVVLICNSLIFGRLCCLHIFVCLVWYVFVVDLASSCCYLIWGWGYWKYLYYPN